MGFAWRSREKRHGLLLDRPLEDPERCRQCDGACCRAFPSVPLTWDEYQTLRSLGAKRLEFSLSGHHLLLIDNGCEFLTDGLCAIYPQRPEVCRRFYCSDCKAADSRFDRENRKPPAAQAAGGFFHGGDFLLQPQLL